MFWKGTVLIDGAGGSDTIILHAGSGANVTVRDAGATDELSVVGTGPRDQIQVAGTTIDLFSDPGSISLLHVDYHVGGMAPIGVLRVSGGDGNDVMTVVGAGANRLELDGGAATQLGTLQRATETAPPASALSSMEYLMPL